MIFSAKAQVTVPFHDVDIMHIVWHGHYLKYFEIARTRLMQSLELDWPYLQEQGIAVPVVEAHSQYRQPILYNQTVEIDASIEEYTYPELKIHYRIRSLEGKELSSGWTRQIYMLMPEKSSCFVVPEIIQAAFDKALALRSGQ